MRRVYVLLFFCLTSLNACAPVILGRTPTPTPVGQTEVFAAAGVPLTLTPLTCGGVLYGSAGCLANGPIGPDYWPKAAPVHIMSAWGVSEAREVNTTFSLSLNPGFRYGGKTLVSEAPKLAFDYGASLYAFNLGLDAGLLASVPFEGGEIYGALRGFGTLVWSYDPSLAASVTLGTLAFIEGRKTFVELTLATGSLNGAGPAAGAAPLGFTLTPAVGFYF